MRLCIVSALYHPSLGGLGRQAQLLTERLSEEGVDLFVIARRMKGMPPAVFNTKVKVYRAWSIKPYLHNFEEVRPVNILISLTFSMSCALLLFWKRKEYDIVHFHGASLPLFFTLPMLKVFRKRVVAKVAAAKIGTEAGSLRGRYGGVGNLIIRLLHGVDLFIATTSEIEAGLREDGFPRTKIRRISNFVDFHLFAPAPAHIKGQTKRRMGLENGPVVTFSGRFVLRKGIHLLLEAWKGVANDFPDARLLLLGDGPLLAEMRELATRLGIASSVDFLGHVPQVTEFLQATDLFVLPSLQEGMPNSLLEAMACGLPAVATRIGGVVDIIQDGENGILVDPGDVNGLAEGMRKLLKDEGLAGSIASRAFQTIQDFYSLDSIASKYVEIYARYSPQSSGDGRPHRP